MTSCTDCCASRATNGLWTRYDSLKCPYCCARLIQQIALLSIARSEATARRKAVLADWIKAGHDEAQIRALVKGPLPLEPVPAAKK